MQRLLFLLILTTSAIAAEPERGKLVEQIAARTDPSQTYTLYLPSTYDAAKSYPVLLILDPRGRSAVAAEIFREAAEEFGWILISSNDTRSDVTSNNPNPKAMNAIVPDALDRYASDDRRIYLAGFSGTAMLSWGYAIWSGNIAGVIGVGGRLVEQIPPAKFNFAHYGFAGDADFNNREMRAIEAILDKESKIPHRFETFDGEHRWLPSSLAHDALGWFELIAMKQERQSRDASLIARLYDKDLATAQALEATNGLAALRRYRAIARTFDGLRPIEQVPTTIERLENDRAIQRAEREELQWDAFERQYLNDVHPRAAIFIQQDKVGEGFRLAELKRRAKKSGAEGQTARRLLEASFTQLGYYLPAQLFESKQYDEAAIALQAALEIHEDRWPLWYNLGAAHARRRDKRHALDALEKAIVHGFKDPKHLEEDEDYANVRGEAKYAALLAKLKK
jgi:predicted esterase